MRSRSNVNQNSLTGDTLQPVTFTNMKNRVNAIKFKTSNKSFKIRQNSFDLQPQKDKSRLKRNIQPETDTNMTNFYPIKP